MASAEMPDSTEALLNKVAGLFGGIAPNVYRVLARAPAALRAFIETEHALETEGLLTEGEQAIVALEVSVYTGCEYCESVFVSEARRLGFDDTVIKTICAGGLPPTDPAQVLVRATRRIVQTHGRLGRHEIADFDEKGLPPAKLLEIITIISGYTLATYTTNLTRTRIDPQYRLAPDDPCKDP